MRIKRKFKVALLIGLITGLFSLLYTFPSQSELINSGNFSCDLATGEVLESSEISINNGVMDQYDYQYLRNLPTNSIPSNSRLFMETYQGIYFVNSSNLKQLLKVSNEGQSIEAITTRSINITSSYYDRTNNSIYFVDCNYDSSPSQIWFLNLSDDSITEITSIAANVSDIWRYNNETYISYFSKSYSIEEGDIYPDGDVVDGFNDWNSVPAGPPYYTLLDEDPSSPDTADYLIEDSRVQIQNTFSFTSIDLSGYESGQIFEIRHSFYNQFAIWGPYFVTAGNKPGTNSVRAINYRNPAGWRSTTYTNLNLGQSHLDDYQLYVSKVYTNTGKIYTIYVNVKWYGDLNVTDISIKNLDTDESWSQPMGDPGGRSRTMSPISVIDDKFCFLWSWSDENAEIWNFDTETDTFTEMEDCGPNTDLSSSNAQRSIATDDTDTLYFILHNTTDSKNYLYTYDIISDILTKGDEHDVILMSDRNCESKSYPNKYEKGFNRSGSKIYQIWNGTNNLIEIANLSINNRIIVLSDNYLITENGELWKYTSKTLTSMKNIVAESINNDLEFGITYGPYDLSSAQLMGIDLDYSYMTNLSQLVDLTIYNVNTQSWDILESSLRTDAFYSKSQYFSVGNEYINTTGYIKIRLNGTNSISDFQLYLNYLDFKLYFQYLSPFYCYTELQITEAINTIKGGVGTIIIVGEIRLLNSLNIDYGGGLIIKGQGLSTLIMADSNSVFKITDSQFCDLKNFRINSSLESSSTPIMYINEQNDNPITIQNVSILGLSQKGYGLSIHSENVLVKECFINDTQSGVYIDEAENCEFTQNIISYNSKGFEIINSGTQGNVFYKNFFIDNDLHAQDDGIGNNWNNTMIGNYWDNHSTTDNDQNGIDDNEYDIPPTGGSKDYLPISDLLMDVFHDGGTKIEIDGRINSGILSWEFTMTRSWCSGLGIQSDPYIISGLTINGQNTGFSCIYIHNTNKYFKIDRCTVFNCESIRAGIKFDQAFYGTIENCNASNNNGDGISIIQSEQCEVLNNLIENNKGHGITLIANCEENDIKTNIIGINTKSGIHLQNSILNDLIGNEISNNGQFAIHLDEQGNDCDWNNIIGNKIVDNGANIENEGDFNDIYWNLEDNGTQPFVIDDDVINDLEWSGGILTPNKWNEIVSNFAWVTGSGTNEDPYLIENIKIKGNSNCLTIINSNNDFLIKDCTFYDADSSTFDSGIKIINANNGNLINNNCSQNNYGIYLDSSNYTAISECTVNENNDIGIALINCKNVTISNNDETINNNKDSGIYLEDSNYNNITSNKIGGNLIGIHLVNSSYNLISDNDLRGNGRSFIEEGLCEGNKLLNNLFDPNIRIATGISDDDEDGGERQSEFNILTFLIILLIFGSVIAIFTIFGNKYVKSKKIAEIPEIQIREERHQIICPHLECGSRGDYSVNSTMIIEGEKYFSKLLPVGSICKDHALRVLFNKELELEKVELYDPTRID